VAGRTPRPAPSALTEPEPFNLLRREPWLLPLAFTTCFYHWLLPLAFTIGFYHWLLPLAVLLPSTVIQSLSLFTPLSEKTFTALLSDLFILLLLSLSLSLSLLLSLLLLLLLLLSVLFADKAASLASLALPPLHP
jgi:hypothetical protein